MISCSLKEAQLTTFSVPPNVTFEVDDIEEPWIFSRKFDFIHSRMMTASIEDWPKFFDQAFK
jgi:hypothetical protein